MGGLPAGRSSPEEDHSLCKFLLQSAVFRHRAAGSASLCRTCSRHPAGFFSRENQGFILSLPGERILPPTFRPCFRAMSFLITSIIPNICSHVKSASPFVPADLFPSHREDRAGWVPASAYFFRPTRHRMACFFLLLFPIRIGLCPSFKRMFPVFTQSRPCFLSFREKESFCRKSGTPVRGVVIFPQILYPYGASDRCS